MLGARRARCVTSIETIVLGVGHEQGPRGSARRREGCDQVLGLGIDQDGLRVGEEVVWEEDVAHVTVGRPSKKGLRRCRRTDTSCLDFADSDRPVDEP